MYANVASRPPPWHPNWPEQSTACCVLSEPGDAPVLIATADSTAAAVANE
jgi:hypothetical protein